MLQGSLRLCHLSVHEHHSAKKHYAFIARINWVNLCVSVKGDKEKNNKKISDCVMVLTTMTSFSEHPSLYNLYNKHKLCSNLFFKFKSL